MTTTTQNSVTLWYGCWHKQDGTHTAQVEAVLRNGKYEVVRVNGIYGANPSVTSRETVEECYDSTDAIDCAMSLDKTLEAGELELMADVANARAKSLRAEVDAADTPLSMRQSLRTKAEYYEFRARRLRERIATL